MCTTCPPCAHHLPSPVHTTSPPLNLAAFYSQVPTGDFLRAAVAHVKSAYIEPFPDSHFSLIALAPKQE